MSVIFPTTQNSKIEIGAFPAVDLDKLDRRLHKGLQKLASKEEEACGNCYGEDDKEVKELRGLDDDEEPVVEKKEKKAYNLSYENGKVRVPSGALVQRLKETDPEGFKQAMAARSELRKMLWKEAKKIDAIQQEKAVLAERSAKRKAIAAAAAAAEAKATRTAARNEILKKTSDTFKSVKDLQDDEKQVLAERLASLGFSKTATDSYLKTVVSSKEINAIPDFIVSLASSDLEKNIKTSVMKQYLTHEAMLSPEQKNRVLDYWQNELGYQDKDWCKDMVADVDPVTGG